MNTRRWDSWQRCVVASIAIFLAPTASEAADPRSPAQSALRGVVLITIDTLRADHLGVYGGPVPTPHLDALASRGVLLEHAVTPTPSTGPAHASLLTGLHPWRHRVLDNAVELPSDLQTLAMAVRDAGISTAAVVSSFVLSRRFGFDRGFDSYQFQPKQGYLFRGEPHRHFWSRGRQVTNLAQSELKAQAGSDSPPFFLWVHYFDPHSPYLPPTSWQLPATHIVDLTGKTLADVSSQALLESLNRDYRGEVRYVDDQIGRLLDVLKQLGLDEKSAVIVTADHGEGLGDHGLLEHGANLFDELVRVPLIVKAPGIPQGRRLAGPAQLEDLFPTVLALFGAPIPQALDGVNLLPWLRGERDESPRFAALGRRKPYPTGSDLYFYRRWPAKWIGALGQPGDRYTLDADPRESAARPGVAVPDWLLDRAGVAATASATPRDPAAMDAELREALEALGYLEPSEESGHSGRP